MSRRQDSVPVRGRDAVALPPRRRLDQRDVYGGGEVAPPTEALYDGFERRHAEDDTRWTGLDQYKNDTEDRKRIGTSRHERPTVRVMWDTPNDRLRWARNRAGWRSAAAFARFCDVEEGTYRHHENGTRGLPEAAARTYADKLDVDWVWLFTGNGTPERSPDLTGDYRPLHFAPLISWVQAGKMDYFSDIKVTEMIPVPHHRDSIFALIVEGSSMNRVAPPGSRLVVDYKDRDLVDKKLYIIRCGCSVTFKRFRNTSGPVRLEPDSFDVHETIFPEDGFEVIGRVIYIVQPT